MRRLAGPRGPIVLAVLGFLLSAGLAFAAPKFPPLTGRVVDGANLLSPQTEAQLTAELEGLETRTGRQLVVATIPDLQDYEIEDYGYQLGRAWGIGDKDRDDGALLLVAPQDRKVRIEVGYGLEPVLTDALSSLIIQERILPAFRDGKMEAGVISGTEALVQQLSLPDSEAKAVVAAAKPRERDGASLGPPLIFILFIAFWLIGGILRGFGRRRGRGGRDLWWLLPLILSSSSRGGGGRGWGGGGGGGFSGGGGSFGGGGSSGGW